MDKIKTELASAIRGQQWTKVCGVLDHNGELLQQLLTEDFDLLHHAVVNGAPADIITRLISRLNINMQGNHGNTVLHCAVKEKRWELVSVLLQHVADVNLGNYMDQTPLHVAAWHGASADIISRLISPRNINMQDVDGTTVLHEAVRMRRWELVPVLLQHRADVNLHGDYLRIKTPLHDAVYHGAPADIITQLISPHNINMLDTAGYTVLHEAVGKERWDLVPVLIQHGANVNLCDDYPRNQTPFHMAARHGAPADIITRLISPHNINMRDKDGDTVLHEVVRKERWNLVPVLLQHGADVNLCCRLNKTPLHDAVYYGAPADIITQLISPHNINMQATDGSAALHEAVRMRRWELVPMLLQYGADSSTLDSPQPDQPLVLLVPSLKAVCIGTIRSNMPVKSDAAYEGLGLPAKLVDKVKLRPQAEDIVNRGHCEQRM